MSSLDAFMQVMATEMEKSQPTEQGATVSTFPIDSNPDWLSGVKEYPWKWVTQNEADEMKKISEVLKREKMPRNQSAVEPTA